MIGRTPQFGLVLLAVATVALAGLTRDWPADNRIEVWSQGKDGSPTRRLDEHFGGDRWVVLRWTAGDPARASETDWLRDVEAGLEEAPPVAELTSSFSLPGAPTAGRPWSVAERPLSRALRLVTRDPPRLVTLLRLDPAADPSASRGFAQRVRDLHGRARTEGWSLEAAGHPLVAAALDEQAARVESLFAPLLAVIAALGLALAWRSITLAAWTVLPAAFTVLSWRGALQLLGWSSNLILVAGAPVILVIVIASLVHLVVSVRRATAGGMTPAEAVDHAVRQKRPAAMMAAWTTALGFGVFLTSNLEPVRRLGVSVGIAVTLAVPLAWWLVGRGLAAARELSAAHDLSNVAWGRLGAPSRRSQGLAGLVTVLLAAFVAVSWARLDFGLSALEYFPEGHHLRQEYAALRRDGLPLSTTDLIATRDRAWSVDELRRPLSIEGEAPPVVLGPALVLQDLGSAAGLAAAPLAEAALQRAGCRSRDGRRARWTILLPDDHPDAIREVIARVKRAAQADGRFSESELHFEGTVQGLLAVQSHLLGTLLRSLGLTLLVSALLFAFVARSAGQWLVALVANLAPVGTVVVAMGILSWPLDAASVMVAAVVMGLAVDNTMHYLAARRSFAREGRPESALDTASLQRVGAAATISSLVLTAGFGALLFAGFAPTSRFGALTALGCLVALFADLWLVPALLHRRAKPPVPPMR